MIWQIGYDITFKPLAKTISENHKDHNDQRSTLWRICCCATSMSTKLKLEAPWEQVKEQIKEINTDITDEDLNYDPGQENELLERLAKKMDRTPDEVRNWIESVSYNRGKAS